ncbi:MAG: hypothetical protein EOO03_00700 [Chitinophagaceae bacterium]|nr:MAG: hypothetical protein EOO03_00700 [Chitinophagaceae bacterium]
MKHTLLLAMAGLLLSLQSMAQNVGIGTTTPGTKFVVRRDGTGTVMENSSTTSPVVIKTVIGIGIGQIGTTTQDPFDVMAGDGFAQLRVMPNGNVGIGTIQPKARLHVVDSSVLFSAAGDISNTPGSLPISGSGRRMMWYADKAAFRVGYSPYNEWDQDFIGAYSIASGMGTKAEGTASTAFGWYSSATGSTSTAFGLNSNAYGASSTAMGEYSTASGENSIAIGSGNTASGFSSTAIAYYNNASGQFSTAIGNANTASGENSTALGSNTIASGRLATAIGKSTVASGVASFATGHSTIAPSFGETTIGSFNEIYTPLSANLIREKDRLFTIGNGNDELNRRNAFTVLKNSHVGIGTSTPTAPLSFASTFGKKISLYHGSTGDAGLGVYVNELRMTSDYNGADITFGYDDLTNGFTENMRIKAYGRVGIGAPDPTATLQIARGTSIGGTLRIDGTNNASHFNIGTNEHTYIRGGIAASNVYVNDIGTGNVIITQRGGNVVIGNISPDQKLSVDGNASKIGGGTWATYSDARVKKNVTNYTAGLAEILAIRPVSFQYNDLSGYTDVTTQFVGVIAQEIENILPNTISKTEVNPAVKDLRSFNSSELTYTLINAVKEQQLQIKETQKANELLQQQNANLLKRLEAIEAALKVK